jgi:ribosomal protein S18 acetylase RimI-like enzyme
MYKLNDVPILESRQGVSFSEINQLTEGVGWGKNFFETEENWKRTIAASSHIAYAKINKKLICFGRLVDDGQICMFYDICVHPDYQRKKIGSLLMTHLIAKLKNKNYVSVGLFIWQGNSKASQFYSKFGFEIVPAMELKKCMREI